MKERLKYVFILGLISMVFLAPAASANPKGGECPMKSGHGDCCSRGCDQKAGGHGECPIVAKTLWLAHAALDHKAEIGLSADQVKAIKELKLEVKKQKIQQKAAMEIGMLEMHSKLKADDFDAEGLKAMMDEGMASMVAGAKASIDQYAKLRSILKNEQIEKLKNLAK